VGIGDGVNIATCVFGIFVLLGGTFESTHMALYAKPLAFLCGRLRTLQYIWVLLPVNKMTNVFFNYNCNYMVMLMTIVSGGRPESSKCNLKF
jgi:hypothetical protein